MPATGRVGVDPADEVLAGRLDGAVDGDAAAGEAEPAAVRAFGQAGGARAGQAAEAVADPVEAEHAVGDERGGAAGQPDAAGRHVQEGAVAVAAEAGAVQPDPALGVLAAPVVADHARPAVQSQPPAAHGEVAVDADRREGLCTLVLGSGAPDILARGKWSKGGAVGSKRSSQAAAASPPGAAPPSRPGWKLAAPMARYPPPGRRSWSGARVTLVATGPDAAASNRVHHSDPAAGSPGGLRTV